MVTVAVFFAIRITLLMTLLHIETKNMFAEVFIRWAIRMVKTLVSKRTANHIGTRIANPAN